MAGYYKPCTGTIVKDNSIVSAGSHCTSCKTGYSGTKIGQRCSQMIWHEAGLKIATGVKKDLYYSVYRKK
jgi:hypothetical protein